MYLTAHRIRLKNRRTGVNAFLNLHGPTQPWPTAPSELLLLPRTHPGIPTSQVLALRSEGSNPLLSYLDVIAPDDTPRSAIVSLIDLLGPLDPGQHGGFIALVRPPLALKLSLPEWTLEDWREELEKLVSPLEELLRIRAWERRDKE